MARIRSGNETSRNVGQISSAGLSYFGGRAHAPNENIRIADFIAGTRHVAAIIERLSALARSLGN